MALRPPRGRAGSRRALADAGYDAARTEVALGPASDRAVQLRRAAHAPPALAAALRFFVLEQPAEADELERLLPPLRAGDLVDLGLAAEDSGLVRPTARIVAHERFLIASDPVGGAHRPDHVMGVTRPTTLLSHLTVRRPVRRALEIGTGNGILALIASTHADRVVATDVNEHALALAELNARLNGVTNVEFRLGSFLEPVEGERFDLVFSNPPYVISPETEYLFRDAGLGRDRLSEHVVSILPDALADDGYATVNLSWIADSDEVAARPLSWLDGVGCDAWLLHTATDDALTSAASWNRDIEGDPERYAAQIDRWVEWYRHEGISSIAYGALILHRRRGGGWRRSTNLPAAGVGPASDHLLRLFAVDDVTADTVLRPAADVVMRHTLRTSDGGWVVTGTELALEGGLGFTAALDGPGAALLSAPDGRTVSEVAEERFGADRVDAAVELARRLAEVGFLVSD
jgi:hypothetical protein